MLFESAEKNAEMILKEATARGLTVEQLIKAVLENPYSFHSRCRERVKVYLKKHPQSR
jgi:hypothetical protein